MKWIVMRAGGVGGYFGGRLAQAGEEVWFAARGERIAGALASCQGVRATLSDDVQRDIWTKFLSIASVSGVGAVARAAARITRLSTLAKRGGSFAE